LSSIRKFAGQTVIYGLGHILSRVVYYLLVVVLLTYLLGESTFEFGAYAYYYAYASLFVILFSFRMDTALFRYGSEVGQLQKTYNTTFAPIFFVAAFLMAIGILFSNSIAAFTPFPNKPEYIKWFSIILAFDVLTLIPFAKLRLERKAKVFALCKIFNVFISSFLIVFFLIVFPKLNSPFFDFIPRFEFQIDYVFISNLIASVILFFVVIAYAGKFSFRIDKPLLKKMTYYVFPLVIVGICYSFIQNFAPPLQEWLLGGTDLENLGQSGIYDSSRRIAVLFAMFTTAFNYAAEPFFFTNSSKKDRELLYGKICRLFTLVGGFVVLSIFLGLDIIQFIVEKSYRESIFIIPILLIAYLLLGIYYNVSIWYKLSDNTWYGAFFSIIGVLVTLIISIVFLPKIGYVASAWATLVSYTLMLVLTYLFGQKLYPISYPIKKILVNLLIVIGIVLLTNFITNRIDTPLLYFIKAGLLILYLVYLIKSEKVEWVKIFTGSKS